MTQDNIKGGVDGYAQGNIQGEVKMTQDNIKGRVDGYAQGNISGGVMMTHRETYKVQSHRQHTRWDKHGTG